MIQCRGLIAALEKGEICDKFRPKARQTLVRHAKKTVMIKNGHITTRW